MKTASIFLAAAGFLCTAPLCAAEKPQQLPPERLANYWLLADTGNANVPNSGTNLHAPSCAAVSYVVEKDGSTSNVKLEKIVPEGDLRKVAVSVVGAMRFTAAKQNVGKTPVATYVVIPFNLPDATSQVPAERTERARILAQCQLDGYGPKPNEQVIRVK